MMQSELENLLGCKVRDYDWPTIQFIYTWSPDIPDVGGKEVLASHIRNTHGGYYTSFLIQQFMAGAIQAAKAAGCSEVREDRGLLVTWDVVHGYCFNDRGNAIQDIYKDVCAKLENLGIMEKLDYFTIADSREPNKLTNWPTDYRWIACYAVTGGSEGHYIHVDIINRGGNDDTRHMMFLGKTFHGREFASEVAAALTEILEA